MVNANSDKELAFMNDLFVATDWGERFAELVDEHVVLPRKGHAAYLAAGTGGHAIALQKRAGIGLKFIGIDENRECLELHSPDGLELWRIFLSLLGSAL